MPKFSKTVGDCGKWTLSKQPIYPVVTRQERSTTTLSVHDALDAMECLVKVKRCICKVVC